MNKEISYGSWAELERCLYGEPPFIGVSASYRLSQLNKEFKKADPDHSRAMALAEEMERIDPGGNVAHELTREIIEGYEARKLLKPEDK